MLYMELQEVEKALTGSSPADWEAMDLPVSEEKAPFRRAVLKSDVDISIQWAWVIQELEEDWVRRPLTDGSSLVVVDVGYRGGLVKRVTLALVDGGRCYLPLPDRLTKQVQTLDDRVARLVTDLSHDPGAVSEYESYFRRYELLRN